MDNNVLNAKMNWYQDGFMYSDARFPCILSGVGTGKTLIALAKAFNHCLMYKDALAMVVRKEFTDLRDSTMADANMYFGTNLTKSSQDHKFKNGSNILFRHGNVNDVSVLKNINLSFVYIEQGEEYENDVVFQFCRDRLRRAQTPIRQLAMIANAKGQNWIWELFIHQAKTTEEYDEPAIIDGKKVDTGQFFYKNGPYECWTANSFANAHNLPDDTIEDWRRMEHEAPNHYAQMMMNSFDIIDCDDMLLTSADVQMALKQEFLYDRTNYNGKILASDIARYGDDKCSATLLQQRGPHHWEQTFIDQWDHRDLMYSTGRILDLRARFNPEMTVIDGDGMGAGVVDRMRENNIDVVEYRSNPEGYKQIKYANKKTEDCFHLKEDLIQGARLKIMPEVMAECQTVRYKFTSSGKKQIISKEEMRKQGVKSPNKFDALMMACSVTEDFGNVAMDFEDNSMPRYSKEESLYGGMP